MVDAIFSKVFQKLVLLSDFLSYDVRSRAEQCGVRHFDFFRMSSPVPFAT